MSREQTARSSPATDLIRLRRGQPYPRFTSEIDRPNGPTPANTLGGSVAERLA